MQYDIEDDRSPNDSDNRMPWDLVVHMFNESNGANWWLHGYKQWPETRCPDLGDWSDTPHDQLDERHLALWIMIDAIKLDELRVKGYNNT